MGQHYEFPRMPFGIVNSGMTMTRAVRKLLDNMDNVADYIDDLLVHTRTWEEHVRTSKDLLKPLKAANLVARLTKCVFGATQVSYLGHRLGQGLIRLQDVNVQKMRDAPRLLTKKEIRSFLGLDGYYQDFIPNFATIAAPLSDLTRKGQPNEVVRGEPQERSYHTVKHAIVNKPGLIFLNVDEEFILRTDASDVGMGATLLQRRDDQIFPVAYASRKLVDRERGYSVMDRECLGIVWGIKRFATYLYGKSFTLQTDHRHLHFLSASKFEGPRIMRWSLALHSYNFKGEHIKGKDNVGGADFHSRAIGSWVTSFIV